MLKFPPIKPYKFTNHFIIVKKNKNMYHYDMFDKNGNLVGQMSAFPEIIQDKYRRFSPNADEYPSFFIHRLFSYRRNEGIGKIFINIAKKESEKHMCLGNIHTIASSLFDRENPPFIFFRKMGFKFNKYCTKTAEYIDECIRKDKQADPNKCFARDIPMFIDKCTTNCDEEVEKYYQLKLKFPYLF